jgi:hypothetical protein
MIRPSCYNIPEGKSEQEALPDELLELLANVFEGVTNAFGDNATLYRLDLGRVYESVQSGDLVVAGQFVDRSDGEVFDFEINQGANRVGYKSSGQTLDSEGLSLFLGEEAGIGNAADESSEPSESGAYPFDLLVQAIREEGSEAYQSPLGFKLRKDLDYLGALSALMYHAGATIEAQPLYTGLHSYAIKYALRGLGIFAQSIGSIQGSEAGKASETWVHDHGLNFAAAVVKEFSSRRCEQFQESIQSDDQEALQVLNDLVEEAIGMAMATTADLIKSVVESDGYQAGDVQATLSAAIEEYCPIDNSEGYSAVANARQLSAEWQEVVSQSGCGEDLSMEALGLPTAQATSSEESGSQEKPSAPPQDSAPHEDVPLAGESIFYVNVGEGPSRNWDDCRKFGFLAAGGGRKWSKQLEKIQAGDTVIAYQKGYGYVGIGRVTSTATPATKFMVNGVLIKELPLINDTIRAIKRFSKENGEYLIGIDWQVAVPREQAAWQANAGLYTTALVCASLKNQQDTIKFAYNSLLTGSGLPSANPPSNEMDLTVDFDEESRVLRSIRNELPKQPLRSAETLDWLKEALVKARDEGIDADKVFENLTDKEWFSDDEFLDFFTIVSIEIASSATEEAGGDCAEIFGCTLDEGLTMWSSYYGLWEQAYKTKSPRLHQSIDISGWGTYVAREVNEIRLISLIPLAAAYGSPVLEALRNKTITKISEAEEEFLGYFASCLAPGYWDDEVPPEVFNIPSTKILSEVLEDWTQYSGLWNPSDLDYLFRSDYANKEVKDLVSRVLRGDDVIDPEGWEQHRSEYWSDESISEALKKCMN